MTKSAKSSRVMFFVLFLTCLLFSIPQVAVADTMFATSGVTASASGTLTFDWQHAVTASGTWSSNQTLNLALPGLNIPTGSTITNASLQLALDPGGAVPVSTLRTEHDYSYVISSYPIYGYSCGFFGCSQYFIGWGYNYGYGFGGTANFNANYGTSVSSISSNLNNASISTAGFYDLLALGFGPDLLAGNAIQVNGNAFLNLDYSISDYGYQSSTTYVASASDFGSLDGTLTVDYQTPVANDGPAPVPEPSSLALLGTGLGFVGWIRRKLNR